MWRRWMLLICLCAAETVVEGYDDGSYKPYQHHHPSDNSRYSQRGVPTARNNRDHSQTTGVDYQHGVGYSTAQGTSQSTNPPSNYQGGNHQQVQQNQHQTNHQQSNGTQSPLTPSDVDHRTIIGNYFSRISPLVRNSTVPVYHCSVVTLNYECQIAGVRIYNRTAVAFQGGNQTTIAFANSRLSYVPKSLFEAFPRLELLNLENLNISTIETQAFHTAMLLEKLYMSFNQLVALPSRTFAGAIALRDLDVSHNKISTIEMSVFNDVPQLSDLHINDNRIRVLPTFTSNQNLRVINATNNNLKEIPDNQFSNNSRLEFLDLSGNRIVKFDSSKLDDNPILHEVKLDSNKLETLHIPNNVKKLTASKNRISRLTVGTCSVEILKLDSNKLRYLPSIDKCSNLEALDLSNNKLRTFSFAGPPSLQVLNLARNNLFQITDLSHSQLVNLKAVDLSHNQLSYVRTASALEQVKLLLLNDNHFIQFDFPSLTKLSHLEISHNEWQCEQLTDLRVIVDQDDQCQYPSDGKNRGICCIRYVRPYSDRLRDLHSETLVHEQQNNESLKQHCKTLSVDASNRDDIRNSMVRNANEEKNLMDVLTKIEEARQVVETSLSKLSVEQWQLKSNMEKLVAEIETQRKVHAIPREGLLDTKRELENVYNALMTRNTFKRELVVTKKRESEETNELLLDLQTNRTVLAKEIATLTTNIQMWKEEELTLKRELGKLEKQLNRNSQTIYGKTGDINK